MKVKKENRVGTEVSTKRRETPKVHVSVTFNGITVSEDSGSFMSAIHFLCHCEDCVRRGLELGTDVDVYTTAIHRENFRNLLEHAGMIPPKPKETIDV